MVKWTQQAKADLRHIHDFIAEDSRIYAKKVTQGILDKTLVLNEFPQIGKVVNEVGDENIRELGIHSWRILYEIRRDAVYVLAIIHKRRDFQPEELK